MKSVIVVGGGAVGLCTAEALMSRGVEVIVLERDRCGAGASAGNAGWITPSLSIPVPGPGVIGQALRWLIDPSGPLWIRPSLSPATLSWLARFVRSCSRAAYARGLSVLQAASASASAAFERLAERGAEFESHREPLLYPAFARAELAQLHTIADQLRHAGDRRPLRRANADELRALEPALGDRLLGGVIADQDWRVRPETLVTAVAKQLTDRGVELQEQTPVLALARERDGWLAHTRTGVYRAEGIVLAAGVATSRLLAALGVRLPVLAAKGYSRTFARVPSGPAHALYLEGPKVAISAFEGEVRVSGTLELGARDLSLSARRLAAITAAAQRAMPGWRLPERATDWAGMRSLSPDGLPFIGAVPGLEDMHVATAHATLGITLAPLTGELLAAQILERRADPLMAAFDPARAISRARALKPVQEV